MREHEAAHMWLSYCPSSEGIAIRSTLGRLKSALAGTAKEVFVGAVRYIDFEKETMGRLSCRMTEWLRSLIAYWKTLPHMTRFISDSRTLFIIMKCVLERWSRPEGKVS